MSTDLIGDEVGVIDHHNVLSPDDVEFSDIRPDYGACATIVWSYFNEYGLTIPPGSSHGLHGRHQHGYGQSDQGRIHP